MKVEWFTIQVQKDTIVKLENVISVTFSNHSDTPVTFSNKGVKRTLPAVSKELNVPVEPFEVYLNNNEFDVEVPINFSKVGTKNVIVDYAQAINKNC